MLDLNATYPGQTAGPTANYPNGEPRNVTVSGDGTGTPLESQWVSDLRGWMEKVVSDAGITVSGVADTALVSDVLTGLQTLLLQRSELKRLGGDVLTQDDHLALEDLPGMHMTWDSAVLMTIEAGARRNSADAADMELPSDLQKDISGSWVVGDGLGGMAGTLAADTWYRRFLCAKPDGTTTWCYDTDVAAANFFALAAPIAAGYSDSTLFRRFGWTLTNGSSQIAKHFNSVDDPRRYLWDAAITDFDAVSSVTDTNRTAFTVSAPPSTHATLSFNVQGKTTGDSILITTGQQTDTPVSSVGTARVYNSSDGANIHGVWELNSSSQIFVRVEQTAGLDNLGIMTDGWADYGLAL